MSKSCKLCSISINELNKVEVRPGVTRNVCNKCRSQQVMTYTKNNIDKRKVYMRSYVRRIGRVKEYPCEACSKPCYKSCKKAYCSDECRFMAHVVKTDDCWLWKGALNRNGYGKLSFGNNKSATAHRVSYKIFKGSIDNDLFVCHMCDVRNCVNPDHLWLGDHNENMIDMLDKGRKYTRLTPDDVLKIRSLYERKDHSKQKLQVMFNISWGHLNDIIRRKVWVHI
jgi:hypothetical protein